ncbi:MAG: hypothetical protein R3C03_01680 [Pirellulaceae bacterium]
MTRNSFFSLLTLAVIGLLTAIGCVNEVDPFLDIVDAKSASIEIDDVDRALKLATSDEAYELSEFEEKVVGGLNRWVAKTKNTEGAVADSWTRSESVSPIVDEYSDVSTITRFDDTSFVNHDVYYLRSTEWLDVLTKRIIDSNNVRTFEFYRLAADNYQTTNSSETDIQNIFSTLNPGMESQEFNSLVSAIKIFDWITRNIQLEQTVEFSEDEIREACLKDPNIEKPWFCGITGPGYHRSVYQLLMYGRGDYIERARLFIHMLERINISAGMLAVNDQPWCVGVRIGEEFYLFDTRLGLPIPGSRAGSVATLSLARSNPEVLANLDLSLEESTADDAKYPVKSEQLENLKILALASPEGLSHRMKFLEERLVGDLRRKLTQDLEQLLRDLGGTAGVEPIAWDIEFRHHAFRDVVRWALAESKFDDALRDRLDWHYQTESYVEGFKLFREARTQFIRGVFETERNSDQFNAVENLFLLMYDDEEIDGLALDRPLLYRLGILQKSGQNSIQFEQEVRGVQASMRLVRRDAGISLAQCQFDNGNDGTAANWLERIAENVDAERWLSATRYLLGRAFESRREYDRAIDEFGRSTLAQKNGNLLRRRFLTKLVSELNQDDAKVSGSDLSDDESNEAGNNAESADEEPKDSDTNESTNEEGDGDN